MIVFESRGCPSLALRACVLPTMGPYGDGRIEFRKPTQVVDTVKLLGPKTGVSPAGRSSDAKLVGGSPRVPKVRIWKASPGLGVKSKRWMVRLPSSEATPLTLSWPNVP